MSYILRVLIKQPHNSKRITIKEFQISYSVLKILEKRRKGLVIVQVFKDFKRLNHHDLVTKVIILINKM